MRGLLFSAKYTISIILENKKDRSGKFRSFEDVYVH